MDYAVIQTKKIATIIINKAVSTHITENLDADELFIITKNNDGEIKSIDFNPIVVNKTLTLITNNIQTNLKYIEEGKGNMLDLTSEFNKKDLEKGIIYKIPSGIVFNNSLLNNLGPSIPVKLNFVGNIVSNIKTNITNYGINNALIEIKMYVAVEEKVILPFSTKTITVENEIPISLKLIQGNIPNYYFGGFNQTSPIISVPME